MNFCSDKGERATNVRTSPTVDNARTGKRPRRSPKWPHEVVERADVMPMISMYSICKLAALACTAGSALHGSWCGAGSEVNMEAEEMLENEGVVDGRFDERGEWW
jgi:hypothetical protein